MSFNIRWATWRRWRRWW